MVMRGIFSSSVGPNRERLTLWPSQTTGVQKAEWMQFFATDLLQILLKIDTLQATQFFATDFTSMFAWHIIKFIPGTNVLPETNNFQFQLPSIFMPDTLSCMKILAQEMTLKTRPHRFFLFLPMEGYIHITIC